MPKGGVRPGAGRKRGSLSKKTREIAEKAQELGITPLEVMLGTMRALWEKAEQGEIEYQGDEIKTPLDFRLMATEVAHKAAPYIHPKLSNIDANIKGDMGIKIEIVKFREDDASDSAS